VIVIVSWNVRELLAQCLTSVAAAVEGLSIKTVVVDNDSADGSADMVREQFPEVELISSGENLGFAKANNRVLKNLSGQSRQFLLLNPDTVVSPDTFRNMIEFMDSHPSAGIVGCKVIKPDGTLDWACKCSYIYPSLMFYRALGLDRRFPNSRRFGRYQLTYLDPNEIHEVDSVTGAFMMIRSECLEQIGFLDESFFMYSEDSEFCYRAKAAGWKIFYVPTSTIVHHKGGSSAKASGRMIYHWYSGTWRLYKKHLAASYSFPVNALVWTGLKFMLMVSSITSGLSKRKGVPSRR
jgi:GT2 family glycosyltransferase